MKKLVILGAGTAGTMILNKLYPVLDRNEWQITIVDQFETHYYQPGFLFIPFGIYSKKDVIKPKRDFFPTGVNVCMGEIDKIEPGSNRVLMKDGKVLGYDYLIVATGSKINPGETEGMLGDLWYKKIFDFYTIEGAVALANFFKHWEGGKLVVNITEMPIKCPVAPLEFVFLADWYFTERGIRDKVEIHFVTPLPGAFTKPKASSILGDFLDKKNIKLTTDFSIGRVDNENQKIISWDEREVPFDCLVTIPTNMGDEAIARSGMGDELNFIPTDKHTLVAEGYDNIFVIGDATNLPSSKAGSVAHFEADILFENFIDVIEGRKPRARFDGHANCFIESGFGKGILIDFNYDTEPLPGKFPLPGVGPFSLLEETKMNHYGKVMFRWMYWNFLIKGKELPIESHMSMAGKRL
ncbi:Pyridine nucleotide-disulfide oxidoreductase domain protein [Melioribacter roseus P3M-2]|uniref:Pyridine nucleotide-disulfide oxidoreductase domain protein n=1 Tax=Melioribacter roseus (strain DSM 23840 / JCM 17771 / VKM B-2668 / P3M-2) TaxID=1191523 RepID=I6Z535_MELRP|nr:FAD/NAD(P)-binding oxidoreductase [Melioribacter roseus]AFN74265.1 Pyridine nucleotide-disulfide oxidoreductase domain protein [Melioribacter roseus P3M-2]